MFRATWSWLVPLLAAFGVFTAVLLTTPPGFGAIGQAMFPSSRGPTTDAAAYALAAAASLALLALVLVAAVCAALELVLRRLRS